MKTVEARLVSGKPTIRDYLEETKPAKVCLHLGCGGMRFGDFINVDLYDVDQDHPDRSRSGCDVDAIADMRHLGLEDNTIDEIFTSHTMEHFVRWEAIAMLSDWLRMLKPGGKLVIETPDFWRCILRLFHWRRRAREMARNMFYGNQWDGHDFETHRYVWASSELQSKLLELGFQKVEVTHATLTHVPGRDMRVIATK